MVFWTPRGNNKRTTIDVYRCYLAGRRYAGAVAIRQLLSAADHGHHFAAEHTDPWLEPARARRVPGLRVHHFVDSAVPVHQHGRAQVQARLSPVPSPSHVTPSAPSQDRLSTWRHPPLRNVTGRVPSGAVFAPQNVRRSFSVGCSSPLSDDPRRPGRVHRSRLSRWPTRNQRRARCDMGRELVRGKQTNGREKRSQTDLYHNFALPLPCDHVTFIYYNILQIWFLISNIICSAFFCDINI